MEDFRYMVTVRAATHQEADQVIAERLGHDEDYGFPYELPDPCPMYRDVTFVFADDVTGQEYDVRMVDGGWNVNDDDGRDYFGVNLSSAILAARVAIKGLTR